MNAQARGQDGFDFLEVIIREIVGRGTLSKTWDPASRALISVHFLENLSRTGQTSISIKFTGNEIEEKTYRRCRHSPH